MFFLGWIENNVEKGENAGYEHFPFFPQYVQKGIFPLDVGVLCGIVVNCLTCKPGIRGSSMDLLSFTWACPWARHFRAQAQHL